ncbi:hypothetical protein ACEQ8H_007961 [Pleosporales sp. CAS-2024a]
MHHLDLVPGTHHHPFVHRREVDQHMAALRAGSPSTLRSRIDELELELEAGRDAASPRFDWSDAGGRYHDFSRTVYYGTTMEIGFGRLILNDFQPDVAPRTHP